MDRDWMDRYAWLVFDVLAREGGPDNTPGRIHVRRVSARAGEIWPAEGRCANGDWRTRTGIHRFVTNAAQKLSDYER